MSIRKSRGFIWVTIVAAFAHVAPVVLSESVPEIGTRLQAVSLKFSPCREDSVSFAGRRAVNSR